MKREASPYEMAIGWYPTHIEYTLCRKQRWYSSQFSVAGSFSDSAYFAVTLLKHLGIRPHEVGQVYVYGIGAGHNKSEIYQSLFSSEPEFLNPLSVVDLYPGSLTSTFDAESYVPCIGAALGL